MKGMRRLTSVLVLLVLAGVAACSKVAFQQPDVQLAGVRLGGIGLKGGLIYAQLNVDNPNSYSLKANKLKYDLDLKDASPSGSGTTWVKLAQGTVDKDLKIAGHNSAMIEIPIEFNYSGAGSAIKSVLDRGTFNYRVNGTVGVTDPVSTTIPFNREGVVSLAGVR